MKTMGLGVGLFVALFAVHAAIASAPPGLFVISGATVKDTKTGLTWQRDYGGPDTWTGALTYCQNLNLDGGTGFRLPSIKELATLQDDFQNGSVAIDTTIFPLPPPAGNPLFWSSSVFANAANTIWGMNFYSGLLVYSTGAGLTQYERCVK